MSVRKFLKEAKKIQDELKERRSHRKDESSHGSDAHDESNWLISYADMMTLLCGFFIMLFSMAKMDDTKYEEVKKEVSKHFGGEYSTPPSNELAQFITKIVEEMGLEKNTIIRSDAQGVSVAFQSTIFFDTLSADVRPEGRAILDRLIDGIASRGKEPTQPLAASQAAAPAPSAAPATASVPATAAATGTEAVPTAAPAPTAVAVTATPPAAVAVTGSASATISEPISNRAPAAANIRYKIVVEGHTDSRPVTSGIFPSNWELSGARAARVIRLFLEKGFPPDRLTAIGYADTHPVSPSRANDGSWNEQSLSQNRRVVIRVLEAKVDSIPFPEAANSAH